MSETNIDQTGNPPPDSPPERTGDNGTPKTYTEEDVQKILRGQGKELKRLQAIEKENLALSEKRKLEDMSLAEKLAASEKEKEELRKIVADKDARDQARLEAIGEKNKKRIEALPKAARDLIPPGLGPDDAQDQISRVEALLKTQTVDVHGGGGRSSAQSPEEEEKAQAEKLSNFFQRNKDKDKK